MAAGFTHFDEALADARREEARSVLEAAARKTAAARGGRRWVAPAAALAALLLVGRWIQAEPEGPPSALTFGPQTVVSAQAAGLGADIADLVPADEAAGRVEVAQPGSPSPAPGSVASGSTRPAAKCAACEAAARARQVKARRQISAWKEPSAPLSDEDVLEDPEPEGPLPSPTPEPAVAPLTLNVGSLFDIALDLPVLTGAVSSPVAGHVLSDVRVRDRLALPAGARVVGEAFSTTVDDRARLVFKAVVLHGRTIPLDGVGLGADSAFGVPGRVLRKGSSPKAGIGRVMGSVGRALSFGLIGGSSSSSLAGAAEYGLEAAAGNGMQELAQQWRRSDKVIRVEAGARVRVYLQQDLALERGR